MRPRNSRPARVDRPHHTSHLPLCLSLCCHQPRIPGHLTIFLAPPLAWGPRATLRHRHKPRSFCLQETGRGASRAKQTKHRARRPPAPRRPLTSPFCFAFHRTVFNSTLNVFRLFYRAGLPLAHCCRFPRHYLAPAAAHHTRSLFYFRTNTYYLNSPPPIATPWRPPPSMVRATPSQAALMETRRHCDMLHSTMTNSPSTRPVPLRQPGARWRRI